MSKEEIFYSNGALRAVIYYSGTKQEIFTPSGQLIAVYNELTNETYSASGQMVGRGNLIMTCI